MEPDMLTDRHYRTNYTVRKQWLYLVGMEGKKSKVKDEKTKDDVVVLNVIISLRKDT